ncbi:hypothetical protein SeseC_00362 [Streptococcus equi subsp. zooepidemicus ATCC 35246]|nr:hypothetical protein SeseC_00362 [Streptococcus equi subsp. zooepidemicus ATCC 35246]
MLLRVFSGIVVATLIKAALVVSDWCFLAAFLAISTQIGQVKGFYS